MTDLPDDLRDRAAGVAALTLSPGYALPYGLHEWRAVVDAVAEVLAGHVGCEHLDGPYRRLVVERDDLRARAERAEADLAQARAVVDEALVLREAAHQARWNIRNREDAPDSLDLDYQRHWRATAVWLEKRAEAIEKGEAPDRGFRPDEGSVSPDQGQETELREEDLLVEHFDVPDQSVIDESGRGVRLTHTPSGVAVESATERTQLQNMAQCVELLRRELAARSVSPDPTAALSGPARAAHTEEDT